MILRLVSIGVTLGAVLALWFGYDQLRVFRGTMFWDYRYIIFAASAFLILSFLEWLLGWLSAKFSPDVDGH